MPNAYDVDAAIAQEYADYQEQGEQPPASSIVTGSNGIPTKPGAYTKTSVQDFMTRIIPPREHIIGPFVKQGLSMVFAPAGVGKTYFSLSLAFAIATKGKFLHWTCEQQQSVIYFDGELPAYLLQDRLKALLSQNPASTPKDFFIVTPDEQKSPMPDLSTHEGQNLAEDLIGDNEFIVIDNLSTLCRTGDENNAQDWVPVQNWLLKLRTQGKSVLLVHHAGKGEKITQRGTSKKEDVLDLIIKLRHPVGYIPNEGCKFEMTFPKSRHFRNIDDTKQLVASYGSYGWEIQDLEENNKEKIERMHRNGAKQKEISDELELSRSYVARIIKELDNSGKISALNF